MDGQSFVAGIAAIVGALVWFTTHQQFKLQLFEKRWSIYERMRQIISECLCHGSIKDDRINEFRRLRHQAKYVFGREFPRRLKYIEDALEKVTVLDRRSISEQDNSALLDERAVYFDQLKNYEIFESIFDRKLSVDDGLIDYFLNLRADHQFEFDALNRNDKRQP